MPFDYPSLAGPIRTAASAIDIRECAKLIGIARRRRRRIIEPDSASDTRNGRTARSDTNVDRWQPSVDCRSQRRRDGTAGSRSCAAVRLLAAELSSTGTRLGSPVARAANQTSHGPTTPLTRRRRDTGPSQRQTDWSARPAAVPLLLLLVFSVCRRAWRSN